MWIVLFMLFAGTVYAQPPSASLEQARNGKATTPNNPIEWVTGNAGEQNAHYRENYSIPYRVVMKNLPVGDPVWIRY